jgi:Tol biopolymer transport system component/DNA-binding winged helix-turn-helix (wHTH) protein
VETPTNITQIWRFGVFEVDARKAELRRGGTPVKMREQSFRILVHLLAHAGEVVTREELRRVLWLSDTFVDFDHSLNTAVMKLRDALGDSAETPLYIETIPKRGYRFIAPVSLAADARAGPAHRESASVASPADEPKEVQQVAPAPTATPVLRRLSVWTSAVIGLLCLTAIGSVLFLRSHHTPAPPTDGNQVPSSFRNVPITTGLGESIFPAFSPDGREIAFAWDGPERKHFDIYVQLLGAALPLRLTYSKGGLLGAPAWSPDGREIAFSRCDAKNDGVYVVPALGGEERKLTTVGCPGTLPGPVAWLPDGKGMLMIGHCARAGPFGVVLFSFSTGEKHCLTPSGFARGSDSGLGLTLSPEGRTVAFTSTTASSCCDIYTVSLVDGSARHLTADYQLGCTTLMDFGFGCSALMWTPDGKSIVFVSNRTTLPSLWRVPANGGAIERETTYPAIGSFSKDGRRLVYSEQTSAELPAIWRADLAGAGGPVLTNRKLISSQYPEMDAQPSPDGSRIVWISIRTGFEELWTSSATGENPSQLTRLNQYSGTPRWSPDGKWIAFDGYSGNSAQIFVVDAEGRNLHSITGGSNDNVVPSWSRDGKWIYFASDRTGTWEVWKHSWESGAELQMTEHGGFDPFESYDGQTIYFSKFDQAGIWSLPAKGGPANGGMESLVVADKPQVGYWGHWAVTKDGLYLLNTDAEPRPAIEFYRFATHHITPVFTFEMQPVRQQHALSGTADGRTIYYTQYDRQSVIKLMEFSR